MWEWLMQMVTVTVTTILQINNGAFRSWLPSSTFSYEHFQFMLEV